MPAVAAPTRLYPNLASTGTAPNCDDRRASLGLCGEQRTWIIGVNWYLNDYVRLMFDYAEAELSGYPLTTITSTSTSFAPGTLPASTTRTVRGFSMRAQSTGKL